MGLPPAPDGLDLSLWFDLSPVRPWEWWGIDAHDWTRAVSDRNAYTEAQGKAARAAKDEAEMARRLAAMGDE